MTWEAGRAARPERGHGLDVALIDGAERQQLVGVRSLGRAGLGVGVIECDDIGPVPADHSRFCLAKARVPSLDRPGALVDGLLAHLSERPAGVLVTARDGSIAEIVSRRAELERLTAVALAPPAALELAVDKSRTLAIAADEGIAIPRSLEVQAGDDAAAAVDEIGIPLVVKPTRSWVEGATGSQRMGAGSAGTRPEALAAIRTVVDAGGTALVQEWLPGRRDTMTLLHSGGRTLAEFAYFTSRTAPMLGGSCVVRESMLAPDDIGPPARRLVAALGLDGYSMVEFRRDAAGEPALMEINPRPTASLELAVRAGIDFPLLLYRWAAGLPVGAPETYRLGVSLRWLAGDFAWLAETWLHPTAPDALGRGRSVGRFLRDFARRGGYDSLDRHDLEPTVVASWASVAGGARRVRKRLAMHR